MKEKWEAFCKSFRQLLLYLFNMQFAKAQSSFPAITAEQVALPRWQHHWKKLPPASRHKGTENPATQNTSLCLILDSWKQDEQRIRTPRSATILLMKSHIRNIFWTSHRLLLATSQFAQSSCSARLRGDRMKNLQGSIIKLELSSYLNFSPLGEYTGNTENESGAEIN